MTTCKHIQKVGELLLSLTQHVSLCPSSYMFSHCRPASLSNPYLMISYRTLGKGVYINITWYPVNKKITITKQIVILRSNSDLTLRSQVFTGLMCMGIPTPTSSHSLTDGYLSTLWPQAECSETALQKAEIGQEHQTFPGGSQPTIQMQL